SGDPGLICDRDLRSTDFGAVAARESFTSPGDEVGRNDGELACQERLGGMLKYYHRRAA
ncbi:MAG: hypothetical protein ACI9G1_001432, partial [Pirellulaceae bacterium]